MKKLFYMILVCGLLFGCGEKTEEPALVETENGFAFVGTGTLPDGLEVQGHRGARGLVPENTMPAFETALDLGVTTLEFDLHFTQDQQVVVWHDPVIDKEKCRLPADSGDHPDPRNPLQRIMISQRPLATIQAYQCDQNPDSNKFSAQEAHNMPLAGSDYKIVTLDELFDFVERYANSDLKSVVQRENAGIIQFNIETKRKADHPEYIDDGFTGGEAGAFELAILDIIAARGLEDRVTIQSFDHRSLRVIREINDSIKLAALTTRGEAKLKVYWSYGFNIWSPNKKDVTAELVAEAHELGLAVMPWTVNDPDDMTQLIEMGVDGLISDRPDLVLALE